MNREGIEAAKGICEKLSRQLVKVDKALDEEGGKLPANDVTYLKELTGSVKNIETILAMAGDGNSERRGRDSMGRYTSRADGMDGEGGNSGWGYYPGRAWDGGSYDGRSYRGYDGRSMHGNEVKEQLRDLMEKADDERVKRALHTAMQQI